MKKYLPLEKAIGKNLKIVNYVLFFSDCERVLWEDGPERVWRSLVIRDAPKALLEFFVSQTTSFEKKNAVDFFSFWYQLNLLKLKIAFFF